MSDIARLRLFCERAEELSQTGLAQRGFNAKLEISWDAEHADTVVVRENEINLDELRSFVTVFRTFISEDEPIYLGSIFSICHKRLRDEALKERLADARRHWTRSMENAPIRLVIDGQDLTPEKVMDLWINGLISHVDQDYRDYIKKIDSLNWLESPLLRNHFYNAVINATNLVFYLWRVVQFGMDDGLFVEDEPACAGTD